MSAQASVAALFRACGFRVYVTSQNRTSHVARGLADFFFLSPRLGKAGAFEHKRRGETVSDAQEEFGLDWVAGGGYYVRGDLEDAKVFLRAHGLGIPDE